MYLGLGWTTFLLAVIFYKFGFASKVPDCGSISVPSKPSIDMLAFYGGSSKPTAQDALQKCLTARAKSTKFDEEVKGPSFCAGLIYTSLKECDNAIESFENALKHCPTNSEACFRLGSIYEGLASTTTNLDEGSKYLSQSIEAYTKTLEILYKDSAITERGMNALVIQTVYKAVILLLQSQKPQPALALTKKFLSLKGQYSQAELATLHLLQAMCHTSLKEPSKALESYKRVLEYDYSSFSLNNAALACEKAKHVEEAEVYYKQSLEYNSSHANTYTNYGAYLKANHREAEARTMLSKAIELDKEETESETGHAKVQLASLTTGGCFIERVGDEYVRGLFDSFASTFDTDLVDLEYKGHSQVARLISQYIQQRERDDDSADDKIRIILDLGMGTGLFGTALADVLPSPYLERVYLEGCDLSVQMMGQAKAKENSLYSALHHIDIEGYLASKTDGDTDGTDGGTDGTGDGNSNVYAVVACDVLIYVGELSSVFDKVSRLLVPGGLFSFTIELIDTTFDGMFHDADSSSDSENDTNDSVREYWMLTSGRYGHSKAYITRLASQYGLEIAEMDGTPIRKQQHVDVPSLTYLLTKK